VPDREDDWERDFGDNAQWSEDHHLIRDFFGLMCLLGAFLIFLVVMVPALAALFLRVF
jgi:hypothetical protein